MHITRHTTVLLVVSTVLLNDMYKPHKNSNFCKPRLQKKTKFIGLRKHVESEQTDQKSSAQKWVCQTFLLPTRQKMGGSGPAASATYDELSGNHFKQM